MHILPMRSFMNPADFGGRLKGHESVKIQVLEGPDAEARGGRAPGAVQNGFIRALGTGSEFIADGGMLLGPASQYEAPRRPWPAPQTTEWSSR